MPKLLIFDAFTLLICEKNVAIYALLRCKIFSLKIWLCKILDKFHVCKLLSCFISSRKLRCQHSTLSSVVPFAMFYDLNPDLIIACSCDSLSAVIETSLILPLRLKIWTLVFNHVDPPVSADAATVQKPLCQNHNDTLFQIVFSQ